MASEKPSQDRLSRSQAAVLDAFRPGFYWTDKALTDAVDSVWSPSRIRSARAELVRKGLITKYGELKDKNRVHTLWRRTTREEQVAHREIPVRVRVGDPGWIADLEKIPTVQSVAGDGDWRDNSAWLRLRQGQHRLFPGDVIRVQDGVVELTRKIGPAE